MILTLDNSFSLGSQSLSQLSSAVKAELNHLKKKVKTELKTSVKSHNCILASSDMISMSKREREEKGCLDFLDIVFDLFRLPELLFPVNVWFVDVVVVVVLVIGFDPEQVEVVLALLLPVVLTDDVQLASIVVDTLLTGWSAFEKPDWVVGGCDIIKGRVG